MQSGNPRFFISLQAQLEGDGARTAIWELEIFRAQLEGDGATTAIWELEIFGGRPSWKVTELQLQSGNSRLFGAGPVGRRQGHNCNLGTRDFLDGRPSWKMTGLQLQSGNSKFLVAGLVGRRQGYNCNLGIRVFFGWQAHLEGDRVTTAIWELEIFGGRPSWKVTGLQLQSGNLRFFGWQAQLEGDRASTAIWELEIFGGRPSWKVTGLQLQSGNSRFFGAGPVGRRQGYNCNLGTRGFWWQAQLEDDRAATAIWELEILVAGRALFEGDGATTAIWELESFLGGRPSWKMTGLLLQSENSWFLVWWLVEKRLG